MYFIAICSTAKHFLFTPHGHHCQYAMHPSPHKPTLRVRLPPSPYPCLCRAQSRELEVAQDEVSRLSQEVQALTDGSEAVRDEQQRLHEELKNRAMDDADDEGNGGGIGEGGHVFLLFLCSRFYASGDKGHPKVPDQTCGCILFFFVFCGGGDAEGICWLFSSASSPAMGHEARQRLRRFRSLCITCFSLFWGGNKGARSSLFKPVGVIFF